MEGMENEQSLICQSFCCLTYVTPHSPSLLKRFFIYITGTSPMSPGEPLIIWGFISMVSPILKLNTEYFEYGVQISYISWKRPTFLTFCQMGSRIEYYWLACL